jgi:hypothetical protein
MHLKDIVSTLMLSDFYFNLPLWERKQVVLRLWWLYGAGQPPPLNWPQSLGVKPQGMADN